MRRLPFKLLLAAATAAATLSAAAAAAPSSGTPVLRTGSHGQKVAALQWLLGGHPPNVFTQIKGTFAGKPNGLFGDRTAAAVYAYKFRLGYPAKYNAKAHPIAGDYFLALLRGQKTRPASWVAAAAARLKAIEAATPTPLALKIRAYELNEIGIAETSRDGGPCISYSCEWHGKWKPAIQSSTGQYNVAWCVSTQQDAFGHVGYGHFADDTASVYYAADYYAARNMLHAKPKVGALVLFIDYDSRGHRITGTGHMGYVVKLTATGYVSIEGNASNRVLERWHQLGDRGNVFAYLPGVA